ncbi:hypothetical protein C8R46DRAFT_1228148 [Mycena filopes]|nr:hypothetical protein C8R46DRAFT_1228148 [Mycena filopes]
MPAVVFHLHGQSPDIEGSTIQVDNPDDGRLPSLDQLCTTVAQKFNIALASTVSFYKAAPADTTASELQALNTFDEIIAERTVAVLVRFAPGPSGGLIPFLGGYSEIYPDFLGNYQRLLNMYGHIVHVSYLGKDVYFTDDPDYAGVVFSESEFYTKRASR